MSALGGMSRMAGNALNSFGNNVDRAFEENSPFSRQLGAGIAGGVGALQIASGMKQLYHGVRGYFTTRAENRQAQSDAEAAKRKVESAYHNAHSATSEYDGLLDQSATLIGQIHDVEARIEELKRQKSFLGNCSTALTDLLNGQQRNTDPIHINHSELVQAEARLQELRNELLNDHTERIRQAEIARANAEIRGLRAVNLHNEAEGRLESAQQNNRHCGQIARSAGNLLLTSGAAGAVTYTGVGTSTIGGTVVAAGRTVVEMSSPGVTAAVTAASTTVKAAAAASVVGAVVVGSGAGIVGGAMLLKKAYQAESRGAQFGYAVAGAAAATAGGALAVAGALPTLGAAGTAAIGVGTVVVAGTVGKKAAGLAVRAGRSLANLTYSTIASIATRCMG